MRCFSVNYKWFWNEKKGPICSATNGEKGSKGDKGEIGLFDWNMFRSLCLLNTVLKTNFLIPIHIGIAGKPGDNGQKGDSVKGPKGKEFFRYFLLNTFIRNKQFLLRNNSLLAKFFHVRQIHENIHKSGIYLNDLKLPWNFTHIP